MRDFLDSKLIGMKLKAWDFMSRLKEEERGDTNFVSIIIIIVIVLGIAAIFKPTLTRAMSRVMSRLEQFVG